jgi:hypothetical protein
MKKTVFALSLLFSAGAFAQDIEHKWTTDSTLATPESVLATADILYVSLIDGAGWDADGKGGIALVDAQGKIKNARWVTGLHAPKGMAIVKGVLYTADLTEIVSIDIKSGKVLQKQKVEGAQGLNDVTADTKGNLYFSDTRGGKVWKYSGGKASVYLEDVKDANGVKWHNNKLYLTANNAFLAHTPGVKELEKICDLENGGDGIEPYKDGFFVTSWLGYLYHVDKAGKRRTLRETHQTNKYKTADIGLRGDVLYIPTFFGNTVEAWKIK